MSASLMILWSISQLSGLGYGKMKILPKNIPYLTYKIKKLHKRIKGIYFCP